MYACLNVFCVSYIMQFIRNDPDSGFYYATGRYSLTKDYMFALIYLALGAFPNFMRNCIY